MNKNVLMLSMASLTWVACGVRQPKLTYPEAAKVDTVDVYFGTEVPDPYGQTVETYYAVAHHIEEGCKRLVQQVLKFEIKQ